MADPADEQSVKACVLPALHADLVSLPIDFFPYAVVAERAWQLRDNFTVYDASYVALAELAEAALVTLDRRLARAPGAACQVLAYE